jgi:hypothetical protein
MISAVGAGQWFFDLFLLPPVVRTIVGYSCPIVGLAIIILLWLPRHERSRLKKRMSRYGYSIGRCGDRELRLIAEIAEGMFGDTATSLEQTMRLHRMNGEIFKALKDRSGVLRGYLCLMKLTRSGVDAVKRDDFSVRDVPPEYIHQDVRRKNVPIYIGAVYGADDASEMYIMGCLEMALREASPPAIYARAATARGLELLTHYNFTPIRKQRPEIGMLFELPTVVTA